MANYKIEDIEGIGEVTGKKFRDAGVKDTDSLLAASTTPTARAKLAEATGLSAALVLKFANMADLYRISGVGAQAAGDVQRLRQAGLVHQRDQRVHAAVFDPGDQAGFAQLPEQTGQADGDAHARQLRLGVVAGQVFVAAARADRADLRVFVERSLVHGAGVVIQAAGDGDALLFSAGKLRRIKIGTLCQTNLLQQSQTACARISYPRQFSR